MANMKQLAINLWFADQAEQAVTFYTSIFKDSKVGNTMRYGTEGQEFLGQKPGSVMTIDFELNGSQFVALNGGPIFKFNEAVSFIVYCDSQEEIDYYWDNLSKGGDAKAQQCGWLKDQYGLSWQIVPSLLRDMPNNISTEKWDNVMKVLLPMKKLDYKKLEAAFNQ